MASIDIDKRDPCARSRLPQWQDLLADDGNYGMAISEIEAADLIKHIEKTVRSAAEQPEYHGILDLLNQWRSDVDAGRSIERKLSVRQSPGLDVLSETPRTRATAKGDFVGKEDYNALEQLELLVSALNLAYVAPKMMAERFLDMVAASSGEADPKASVDVVVEFVGVGETDAAATRQTISRAGIAQSHETTKGLSDLLAEIAQDAGFKPRTMSEVTA